MEYRRAQYNIQKKIHILNIWPGHQISLEKNRWPPPFDNNQVSKTIFRARDQEP
jgi:hypothetical protein